MEKGMYKITVVIGMAAAFAICLMFYLKEEIIIEPDMILPEDTLIMYSQKGMYDHVKRLQKTSGYEIIQKIDYEKIARVFEIDDKKRKEFEEFTEVAKLIMSTPVVTKILKDEVALALITLDDKAINGISFLERLIESLIFVAYLKDDIDLDGEIKEYFRDRYDQRVTTDYEGFKIHSYQATDSVSIFVAKIHNLYAFSFSERTVKHTIRSLKNKGNLSGKSEYRKFKDDGGKTPVFAYVNFYELDKSVKASLDAFLPEEKDAIMKDLVALRAYSYGSFRGWRAEDVIETETIFGLDREKMEPKLKPFFSVTPEVNTKLYGVPENLMVYYWVNTIKVKAFAEYAFDGKTATEQQMKLFYEELKQHTGLTLDEIYDLWGRESFVVLKNTGKQVFMPVPDIGFLIELERPEKLKTLLEKIIIDNKVAVHRKTYNEHKITFWGQFSQNSIQPAYAVVGDMLVFSSSESFMHELLDNMENTVENQGDSIEKIISGFNGPSNSISFIQVHSFIDLLKECATWAGTMFAITDKDMARKANVLVHEFIHPLLESMKIFSAFGYRGYVTEESVIIETSTLIEEKE